LEPFLFDIGFNKPDSVLIYHLTVQSTLQIERVTLSSGIHDLAPHKVYQAKFITEFTGALLPHLFTLTLIT